MDKQYLQSFFADEKYSDILWYLDGSTGVFDNRLRNAGVRVNRLAFGLVLAGVFGCFRFENFISGTSSSEDNEIVSAF